MKKLFLTSGGFAQYQTLSNKFINLVGKNPQDIKILLVSAYPFISEQDDTTHYYDPKNVFFREYNNLIEIGFLSENLVKFYLNDEWKQDIMEFDAIYINGGDGRLYSEGIERNNFRSYIDQLINGGGVYAGISAGSFLALSFGPELLGYADCKFDVHSNVSYPIGTVDRIRTKNDIIALANNQTLMIIGDEWTVIE